MILPQAMYTPAMRFTVNARTVQLLFYGEMIGEGRWDGEQRVMYAQPTSVQDAEGGMVHAKTGIWFPASEIIETEHGRQPRPFAHEERS